ncbi:MAG: SEL1-like repeat protein [Bacteroidetes bacterium]|nr:SEL1-like repeat protein [Bacteroidota bacterium]
MGSRVIFPSAFLLVALLSPVVVRGQELQQDHPNSSVFKDYKASDGPQLIRPSDVTYQLWEALMLMRRANSGDPVAQEELGFRYFLGKGFHADTTKAAYWIEKAADQNMSIAEYNLGVFLNNGWGVSWNPFKAYERFKSAAEDSLPEGEFAYGLFYTDNLVVPRNWETAYHWLKLAEDAKFEPAKKVIDEFIRRGIPITPDSERARAAASDSSLGVTNQPVEPLYLDYGPDTSSNVNDLTLLNEAFKEGNEKFRKALGVSGIFEKGANKDTSAMSVIESAAAVGSPEALAVLGRCYERGAGVPRDRILAAEQYLRAARMDSRHGLALLLRLVREKGFAEEVEARAKAGDYDAAFVWAGLTELGLDHRLLDDQAFHLLVVAADHGNIPSLIELGRCYYTGQWTARNPILGAQCWERAADQGSRDAGIRLAAAAVISDSTGADTSLADAVQILTTGVGDGSMIAQLALGYCYEHGVGVLRNTPLAVKLYRECAQRGSESAYSALKQMYDKLRPKGKEFDVNSVSDMGS